MANRKRFIQREVLNMQLLSAQQYITNPTLLIQLIRINLSILDSPYVLVGGALLGALAYYFIRLHIMVRSTQQGAGLKHAFLTALKGVSDGDAWRRCGQILKCELLTTLKGSLNSNTWSSWVTPITGVGGLLGLIVLVRTNELFTELSLLFGALLLLGTLVSEALKGRVAGTVLSTLLTLWAAFGEILATITLLVTFNLSSLFITWTLRIIAILTIVLLVIYCKRQPKQQSGKQANSSSEEQAGSHSNKRVGTSLLLVESNDPRELTAFLQPYMDLVSFDVPAVHEVDYNQRIEEFQQVVQQSR
jgi:hypothetical protein